MQTDSLSIELTAAKAGLDCGSGTAAFSRSSVAREPADFGILAYRRSRLPPSKAAAPLPQSKLVVPARHIDIGALERVV